MRLDQEGFDNGNMLRSDNRLHVSVGGVYAVTADFQWFEADGKYEAFVEEGPDEGPNTRDVAFQQVRDGDRGPMTTIVPLAAGRSLQLVGCWEANFAADARFLNAGSSLSAQWLGPLP